MAFHQVRGQELAPGARIAVIGSSLAGLLVTHFLSREAFEVHLYDASSSINCPEHTSLPCRTFSGEILKRRAPVCPATLLRFNPSYEKELFQLLEYLKLISQRVHYSFSLQHENERLPFFRHRRLWVSFLCSISRLLWDKSLRTLLYDLARYWVFTPALLRRGMLRDISFETDMRRRTFSRVFYEHFLLASLSSSLSCSYDQLRLCPAENIASYLLHHCIGLKTVWRGVKGGICKVLEKLWATFPPDRVHLNERIQQVRVVSSTESVPGIRESEKKLELCFDNGLIRTFDAVVVATKARAAARLLASTQGTSYHCLQGFSRSISRITLPYDAMTFRQGKGEPRFNLHIRIPKEKKLGRASITFCFDENLRNVSTRPLSPIQVWNPHVVSGDEEKKSSSDTWDLGVLFGTEVQVTSSILHFPGKPTRGRPMDGDHLEESNLRQKNFVRPIATVYSEKMLREIFPRLQGNQNIWLCENYMTSGGVGVVNEAVSSAFDVLQKMQVALPFNP